MIQQLLAVASFFSLIQPSLAQLSCDSDWISHNGDPAHCEMRIRSDQARNHLQICGIHIPGVRGLNEAACKSYCDPKRSALQADLEALTFQRVAFMQGRMEHVASFLAAADAARETCEAACVRADQLEIELKLECKAKEEACKRVKDLEAQLSTMIVQGLANIVIPKPQ